MSLNGTSANCAMDAYPGTHPAAVIYNNGEVLACGGEDLENADRCWSFDGSTWSSLPNSNQKHCYYDSRNVLVNDGWMIAGQLQFGNGGCDSSNSTSEIYTGTSWKPGPALPGDGYSCVVNLNATHTVLIGGNHPLTRWIHPPAAAWLYDWTSQLWTRTGSLIQGRYLHGCVSLDGQGILVAGGYDRGQGYTVDLYNPVQGTWSSQPDLPRDIEQKQPLLLNWDGQVLALFDRNAQIYKRSRDTGEWSVLKGVHLPSPFEGYSYTKAVLVPDNWSCNPAE